MFRLMFSPSKALAERVESTMESLQLVPSQYSSVHLRVKYPVDKSIDEKTFTFQKHKDKITSWATNAVNCAAELHPNSTIYVSSDNNDTVGYLLEDSHFAQHYIDATKHNKHPLVVKLVARDYSQENEHVAFSSNKEADGFMDVFIDLMILGMGKCVAHVSRELSLLFIVHLYVHKLTLIASLTGCGWLWEAGCRIKWWRVCNGS